MPPKSGQPADGSPPSDSRPPLLQPEVMPTAKPISVEPKLRAQALPEKEDHRFFDRWMFDLARDLGERAVKIKALERLIAGGEKFADWRAEGKGLTAEQENAADLELIASTDQRVAKAEEEAQRSERGEAESRQKVGELDQKVEAVTERRARLSPALRGSRFDGVLVLAAGWVVFAVDLAVIRLALNLTIGSAVEHKFTAVTMGAGAAVVAAALGWLIAAGAIDSEGRFKRLSTPFMLLTAQLSILALWFFIELGLFRSDSLQKLSERNHQSHIGDPKFFAVAQIVFFGAAVLICFSYFARRTGRELGKRRNKLEKLRGTHQEKAKTYRDAIERARREAAEAPIKRDEATARIYSRTRIAEAAARRDRTQGSYLAELVWAIYHKARAEVEIGSRIWIRKGSGTITISRWLVQTRLILVFAGTVGAGGAMYWVTHSVPAAILSSLIVATAVAASVSAQDHAESDKPGKPGPDGPFRADIGGPPDGPDDGRSSDIRGLRPFDGNGNGSGNGHRAPFMDQADLEGTSDYE